MSILPTLVGSAATIAAVYFVYDKLKGIFVAINDDLAEIKGNLVEAKDEIVAKIAELEAQLVAAGADPALIAEVKTLAEGLADIVPDAPVEGNPVEGNETPESPIKG